MPKFMKRCKVCGKEYESCHTPRPSASTNRWQDVACCAEHAAVYFAAVYKSRANISNSQPTNFANNSSELVDESCVTDIRNTELTDDNASYETISVNEVDAKPKRNKKKGDND